MNISAVERLLLDLNLQLQLWKGRVDRELATLTMSQIHIPLQAKTFV